MKLMTVLTVSLFASISICAAAHADEHGKVEEHKVERAPAPKFVAHPSGVHPNGATAHSHPIRVLAPKVVVHGAKTWAHWEHPDFVRPVYYWDWASIHSVSCTAEDSYGDQYPVTETARHGFGLSNMTDVEDDALDRCYSESGQDNTCYLATCSHV